MLPIKAIQTFEKLVETTLTPEVFLGSLLMADLPQEKWNDMALQIRINTFVKKTQSLAGTILSRRSGQYEEYLLNEFDKKVPTRQQYSIPDTYEAFNKEYGDMIQISDIAISKYFDSIFNGEELEDGKGYASLDFVLKLKDGSNIRAHLLSNSTTAAMVDKLNKFFNPRRYGDSRVFTNIASYVVFTASPDDLNNEAYFTELLKKDISEINALGYALSLSGGILGRFLESNTRELFKRFF
jgi:hypothetical protein